MAVVDLLIKLKDEATAGLRGVRGALSGLGNSATEAAGQTQGLVGAIAAGVLQANAIQFAVGKATQAIGFMNSKFEEAKSLQLANVTAATTFSSLTGQSYEEAAKFIDNLNARLAQSAAALPGATQDYKNLAIAIQDNVLEAFKDPAGKLNQKGFEDTIISISESFGALSAASNVATGNTTLGLSKALGGASTAELRQIQFFEQNAVILNEIDKRLQAMGKTALKDLNIKERVKLLEEVGKKFITEDFKKNAGQTVDALMQSFQSTLFDPSTGIFGVMRDLDINTNGVQSAFSAFNDSIKLLIGNDGLFNKFGSLLTSLGLNADPMAVLRNGILLFNDLLSKVNSQVDAINSFVKVSAEALSVGTISISDIGFTLTKNVGEFLDSAVQSIGAQLVQAGSNLPATGLAIASNVGNFFKGVATAIAPALTSAAASLPDIGFAIIKQVGLFLEGAAGLIGNQLNVQLANAPSVLGGFLGIAGSVLTTGIQDLAARFLDLPVGGQLTAVAIGAAGAFVFFNSAIGRTIIALGGLTVSSIPTAIGAIAGVGNAVIGLGNATAAGAVGILRFVSFALPGLISTSWASIVAGIGSLTTTLTTLSVGSLWSALVGGMTAAGSAILTFAGTVTTAGIALLANPIVLGISAIALAAGLIYKYWEPITQFFSGFAEGLISALGPIMPALSATGGAIANVFSPLVDLFRSALHWLGQLLTPVKDTDGAARDLGRTFGEIVGGGIMTAVNAVKTFLDWLGQGLEKLKSFMGVTSQAATGLASAFNFQFPSTQAPAAQPPSVQPSAVAPAPAGMTVGARYSGQIGTAADGFLGDLMSAARKEVSAMPSGAQLVVANTTETILPRGILGELVKTVINTFVPQTTPAVAGGTTAVPVLTPPPVSTPATAAVPILAPPPVPMATAAVPILAPPPVSTPATAAVPILTPPSTPTATAAVPILAPPPTPPATAAVPILTSPPAPMAAPTLTPPITPIADSRRSQGGNTINLQLTINAPAGDANAITDAAINAIQQLFEAELNVQLG